MSTIKESALLLSRILLGVILIAHGWDKFQITGLEGVSGYFDSLGIPAAAVAAPAVALIEIIGGALLILGLFTPIVSIIITVVMVGAALFAHLSNGIFITNGGWELVGAIAAGTLALAALGAGRYSMDALLDARGSITSREPVAA